LPATKDDDLPPKMNSDYFLCSPKRETATKKVPVNYSAELRNVLNRWLERRGYQKLANHELNGDFFVSWEYMENKRKRQSDDDDRFFWQCVWENKLTEKELKDIFDYPGEDV
jgi:hypothetical protein